MKLSTANYSLQSAGFTAVELIITMAIVAIVLAVGVPSFQSTVTDRKQSSQFIKLRKSLVFARSEAIKRAQHVSVCARASNTNCGDDWSKGWLIFTDADTGTAGVLDPEDSILRLVDLSSNGLNIKANAVIPPTAAEAQKGIRFSPRGRADWSLGTLVLCDSRGAEHALGLIVNGAGSFRTAYTAANSNGIVIDAMGAAVECA